MGELRKLGPSGDTKIIWDSDQKAEIEVARNAFNKLKEEGYFAYEVKSDGDKGIVIDEFDREAEKIIMALPMRGG
jgi:hypothetical protein